MLILILFAFLAGIVTILSPCILPVLPIILSATINGKKRDTTRPFGIVIGFILSFTFFTLFLSTLVRLSGIPADSVRVLAVIIIAGFGVSLLVPRFQLLIDQAFSKLANFAPKRNTQPGFWSGLFVGFSLGLVWTPCVGPILASVIVLAITGTVTFDAFLITLSYAIGTAIPLFVVMFGGQKIIRKVPWLLNHTQGIQKAFGMLMILTAVGIFTNVDRTFQTFILRTFPQYGVGLTKLEDTAVVKQQLEKLGTEGTQKEAIGKPMYELAQPKGALAPEIIPGGQWFNSEPLTLAKLRGKVVLIDFWTYSCINCQRTLPYLKSWWEKYKDKGLVIIGVHSPEFEFEKNPENVRKAIADFKLTYPIVQDNNFSTWRAYENQYWPAKYFIDKEGYIRHTHFGEGDYDESERVIQELLQETGATGIPDTVNNPQYQIYAQTPETYLGYERIANLASPEEIVTDKLSTYSIPKVLSTNEMAYAGSWSIMKDYANPQKGAKLYFNFEAKEVYLVMRTKNKTGNVRVFVDDAVQYFGTDNQNGTVTVDADRLYRLITLPAPGRHTLKLEFEDDSLELYAFTFG
jgi:cytochrome c biogenesis protein CcdA/thiol-disulfide isomerase/thioredoxin